MIWRGTRTVVGAFLVLFAVLAGATANADNFVKAQYAVDIVYDDARGLLYITSGFKVLRYQLSTHSFIDPIKLGGQLKGIDISPDGSMLAVADASFDQNQAKNWVHLFNLNTGTDRKLVFQQAFLEGGTWAVAYGADGKLLISSRLQGSGQLPLRRYDPVTHQTSVVTQVEDIALLSPSVERSFIGIANYGDSTFRRYKVIDHKLIQAGSPIHNNDVAVSPLGKFFAIETEFGTNIYDKRLNPIGVTIVKEDNSVPRAVAFDPVKPLAYFLFEPSEIDVYSTKTWTQVDSFSAKENFSSGIPFACRVKLSQKGTLLFATVAGGVRIVETRAHE